MKSLPLLAALLGVFALLAVACGGDEKEETPATPTAPIATPTSAPPVTPTAAPSDPLLRIIEAATRNDTDALRTLLVFTPTACATNVQGAGGPPDCRPGELDGTLVPVLAIADCEGHYVREDEVALDPLETGTITFVNAYAAPSGFFPPGETVLLFTRLMSGIGEIGLQLIVTDDAVSGIRYGCGITAEEMIELHGLGDPLDLADPDTGISAHEAIVNAAEAGDIDTLLSFVRFAPTACTLRTEGIGGPPLCRADEAEGTLIPVVMVADCEGHLDRAEDLRSSSWSGSGSTFVAAYSAPSGLLPDAAVDTVLMFERNVSGSGPLGAEILLEGGAIVGFWHGCGQTVDQLVELHGLGEPADIDEGS